MRGSNDGTGKRAEKEEKTVRETEIPEQLRAQQRGRICLCREALPLGRGQEEGTSCPVDPRGAADRTDDPVRLHAEGGDGTALLCAASVSCDVHGRVSADMETDRSFFCGKRDPGLHLQTHGACPACAAVDGHGDLRAHCHRGDHPFHREGVHAVSLDGAVSRDALRGVRMRSVFGAENETHGPVQCEMKDVTKKLQNLEFFL